MSIKKQLKDNIDKFIAGKRYVPEGLVELARYFAFFDPIQFEYKKTEEGYIAVSTNFQYGSIVTSGRSIPELEKNIRDAILTSFEVPSSYAREANVNRVGQEEYAIAK